MDFSLKTACFKGEKVWCCSVLSVQGLHVLSSHKRVASFKFGIVLMLLPLEMGLKVQKNNAENTVYSSHVGCLALKGQGNLFWSKCSLFGFGLNFLCLPRDPLPISKVIKTFSYYWQKRSAFEWSLKSRIIALFYCIRNNEFKVKSVSYRKINILRNSARNNWVCSQYLICFA